MTELAKHYDPQEIESRWYDRWLKDGCFHSEPSRGGDPYVIVIPPPM